ncbi:HAD family hydrolase [Streptomyces coerulescens]|uniref:HAD family hydrolase n=1 Tax=Streptomyces coerulescens TaxID=29304 RepID=A0ABW0CWF3_STRCD
MGRELSAAEPVIFRETANPHGLATDRAVFERFARALTAAHLERAAELRERGHALPGAAAVLGALADAGVRQTVVSGNIRAVAEIKLQVFGLDTPILWELGAYREDHDVRADLVRLSLQRAQAVAESTVLIGDTPADIEGAHANGVPVIAVATGRSNEDALRHAGAEVVLPDPGCRTDGQARPQRCLTTCDVASVKRRSRAARRRRLLRGEKVRAAGPSCGRHGARR